MRSDLAFLLLVLLHSPAQALSDSPAKGREASAQDIEAVVQAIQDEIYDYGYQKEFWGFETEGRRGPEAEFQIYISPNLSPTQGGVEGAVIYKYLPFGEVYRHFIIAPRGIAYLMGDPSTGFPWTQPNTRTIYMDDDRICSAKHEWQKALLDLDLKPSSFRIQAASTRQKTRVGFSAWESSRPKRK